MSTLTCQTRYLVGKARCRELTRQVGAVAIGAAAGLSFEALCYGRHVWDNNGISKMIIGVEGPGCRRQYKQLLCLAFMDHEHISLFRDRATTTNNRSVLIP